MLTLSKIKLVNNSDLQKIHDQTIAVLEQTGIKFHSEESIEIFKKHGAKVDGKIVYIAEEMLERAINNIPKQFTWHAIDPQNNIQVGGEQDRVHIMLDHGILGGMVLSQLVNPGTPFVYSPASSVPNMKTASYITGSPESNLINIINLQLANELYHIPTRTMAGLTDAKTVDCQAGLETMQNYFTLMMSGTHMINECIGTLDSILTVSYEKFMIDEEMMSRMLRIMEGVSTKDEDFDISSIKKTGHAGSYLKHPDTVRNCRSTWVPTVSDWESYDKWKATGSEDIVVQANRKYKEVLKNCPESLLSKDIAEQLTKFVDSRRG